MSRASLSHNWGATREECALPFPDDTAEDAGADCLYRGVSVAAAPAIVFRWLCQLRVAPYSYDWIDNRGRQSPRTLTPGLEALERGQTFMEIFRLEHFVTDEHVTLVTPTGGRGARLFGHVRVTYWAQRAPAGGTRLLVKLRVHQAPGLWGRLASALLPSGDLIMMRRQLLNLKARAEASARG
jgi:hypothetical protein